jgi:hypothetical protein
MDLLASNPSHHLEREYEGWLTQGIRQYFRAIGVRVTVFAIGPNEERKWPADEAMHAFGKLVGLQVKRPHLLGRSRRPNDFSRITWRLDNPPAQRFLVRDREEIHYALPTFINQAASDRALVHCVFWRPNRRAYRQLHYDNPRPTPGIPKSVARDGCRWGEFIEKLLACNVGVRVSRDQLTAYIKELSYQHGATLEEEPVVGIYAEIED